MPYGVAQSVALDSYDFVYYHMASHSTSCDLLVTKSTKLQNPWCIPWMMNNARSHVGCDSQLLYILHCQFSLVGSICMLSWGQGCGGD